MTSEAASSISFTPAEIAIVAALLGAVVSALLGACRLLLAEKDQRIADWRTLAERAAGHVTPPEPRRRTR